MKKMYHLCLSAGDEVLFRDLEDYHRGFNCFAVALHKTGSTGLAESFMSTHCHKLVQTEDPAEFMHCFRLPYSMYFNRKYHRSGKLGENVHFTMDSKAPRQNKTCHENHASPSGSQTSPEQAVRIRAHRQERHKPRTRRMSSDGDRWRNKRYRRYPRA